MVNEKMTSHNYGIITKGAPYTKDGQIKRKDGVCKLRFEYGYSAGKISKLLKISRSTINDDVYFWHSEIDTSRNDIDPIQETIIIIERLEIQRTRLGEQLDKTTYFQEKTPIERHITDLDTKIVNVQLRLANSNKRISDLVIMKLNSWLKENNHKHRFLKLFDKISGSWQDHKKIKKIITSDIRNQRLN